MRRYILFFLLMSGLVFSITACSKRPDGTIPYLKTNPKREVVDYLEKVFEVSQRIDITIASDFANIKLHTWKNSQIKFEVTKTITSRNSKLKLEKFLKSFLINVAQVQTTFDIKTKYSGKNNREVEAICNIDIYLPHKLGKVYCIIENGNLCIVDDIKCSLNVVTKAADIKIAKFNGHLNINSQSGNIEINAGVIQPESKINLKKGKIFINAELYKTGKYNFLSGDGIIKLKLPAGSDEVFDQYGNSCMNITRIGSPVKISIN